MAIFPVLLAAGLIGALTALTATLTDRSPQVVPGSRTIESAGFCPAPHHHCAPGDFAAVALPHTPDVPVTAGRRQASYRVALTTADISAGLPSVFIPRFSDNLRLYLDGVLISPDRFDHVPFHHHWHRPYFTSFAVRDPLPPQLPQNSPRGPDDLDNLGDRDPADPAPARRYDLEIELVALPSGHIALSELLVGPAKSLDLAAQRYHVTRLGQLRSFGAVAMFAIVPIFLTWLSRRQDMSLFWITFTLGCGILVALHQSLPNFHIWIPHWPAIWNSALLFYGFGVYHYIRVLFGHPWTGWQTGLCGLSLVGAGALFLAGPAGYFGTAATVHLLSLGLGLLAVADILRHWTRAGWVIRLHVPVLVVAASAGLNDYLFFVLGPDWAFAPRGGLGLIVIVVGVFAALFYRLASTLRGYERLNQTMRDTIETRTAELAKSQARVAQIERQRAIDAERERIMFDLHDGVGGQLINIKSYLETRDVTDDTLIGSIDEAMRDLALIIDSLEGADDLGLLMASLKERLEPILHSHGIALIWRCDQVPDIPCGDPSKYLNTIRILREAITNSMKHAGASEIAVCSDARAVRVCDNGRGFDMSKAAQKRGTHSGLGLPGIRKRATEIGAALQLDTGPKGTVLVLSW